MPDSFTIAACTALLLWPPAQVIALDVALLGWKKA